MELDTEIATPAAEIKVLQSLEMADKTQEDGMNAYLEASKWENIEFLDSEVSLVEFMQMGLVPRTPL